KEFVNCFIKKKSSDGAGVTKKQKDTCAYKHNQCTCAQAVIPFPAGMGSRSNRMPSHPEIKQQNHCQAGDLPSLMRHHPEPHAATARTNRTTFISTQTLSTSIEGALYRVYAFVDSAALITTQSGCGKRNYETL